jgi:carbamoyl-phosphate synthase large subunit
MPKSAHLKKVLVIGSGPIVIGQAAEFDYSGTQAVRSLIEEGVEVVLINSNPATIMTDKETAHKVYIEPLTRDFILKVINKERPDGILPTLGGQTALNLAMELAETGVLKKLGISLLGCNVETIKKAEDRKLFSEVTRKTKLAQTQSREVSGYKNLVNAMVDIGFPVIIRPSYVIGGESMYIFYGHDELNELPKAFKDQLQSANDFVCLQ